MTRGFVVLLVGALLACAPRQKPAPAPLPPRMQDSAPERENMVNEGNPADLYEVEPDKRRFGVPQDQELKRQAKEEKEAEKQKAADDSLIPLPRMGAPDGGAGPTPPVKDKI